MVLHAWSRPQNSFDKILGTIFSANNSCLHQPLQFLNSEMRVLFILSSEGCVWVKNVPMCWWFSIIGLNHLEDSLTFHFQYRHFNLYFSLSAIQLSLQEAESTKVHVQCINYAKCTRLFLVIKWMFLHWDGNFQIAVVFCLCSHFLELWNVDLWNSLVDDMLCHFHGVHY